MPKCGGTENTDLKVDGQDDPDPDHQRSHLAEELQELKSTILRVASERERLPQPLFWSLFRTRIDAIRKAKEVERVIAEELNGGG